MTIPKLTPYTGQVANPDGSQTQAEFTQNMFDQLSYEAQLATQLDATIDGMNNAVDEVEENATSAENSANAAEAAASTAGYQGLWPDTGGSAEKGDTYQTQVSGTPTGEYYTALKDTSVDPVGDDVNWKVNVGARNISNPNLISNSSFEVAGSVAIPPDATPRSYSAGDELFSGSFASDDLVNVTYIDGKLNGEKASSGTGQLYVDIYKTEKQKLSTTPHVASIAANDGVPVESGASFVDNADYWRITFDMDDTFSVKFEQGSVATGHEVEYGYISEGSLIPRTNYVRYADKLFVEDYGDIGKGLDDTDAFKAALNVAKERGGAEISTRNYPEGFILSETLYIPSNSKLDLNYTEVKPVAISLGGNYDSNAVIICGNPLLEATAESAELVKAKINYSTPDADFPSRPFTIQNCNRGRIAFCDSRRANDRCFSVGSGEGSVVEYNYAEEPRFHCYATDDGAERAIFQFNRTDNSKGLISGDSYCFDISAENSNSNPCIVRFNYSTNGQRFFKGQQQACLVYGNYIEGFDDESRTTMVVGFGEGIHIYQNTLVDCAAPWLIGSGADGPATEAYITDNILINRNVPIQTLLTIAQDVSNVVYKSNYHVHPANFTANTRMMDLDRAGANRFVFSDNEFYITGAVVNNECFRITNMNNMEFDDNIIETTHPVCLFWLSGTNNDISRNTFKPSAGGSDTVRIVPIGNSIKSNICRTGRFRVDDDVNNFLSGNDVEVWSVLTTPDNEPKQGSGSPITNAVTPRRFGDEYADTTANVFYRAFGLTSSDWVALN